MASGQMGLVLSYLRGLIREGDAAAAGDGELLDQFVSHRDDRAFLQIMGRHGPMVLMLCQRFLRDPHLVEDAFQATFLVLVQRAHAIRKRTSLASWLYGVAYRVSVRARSSVERRRAQELQVADMDQQAAAPAPPDEMHGLLTEEVARLPEKYRAPIILCCLEGKTTGAAAQTLGWSFGTVSSRLARGREYLRGRLGRRGITIASLPAITALLAPTHAIALPSALADATLRLASLSAAGKAIELTGIAPQALALAQGVIRNMFTQKLKTIGALCVVSILVGLASAALATRPGSPPSEEMHEVVALAPRPVDVVPRDDSPTESEPLEKEGLSITLKSTRRNFGRSDKLGFEVTFKNVGKKEMRLYDVGFFGHAFSLHGELIDGHHVFEGRCIEGKIKRMHEVIKLATDKSHVTKSEFGKLVGLEFWVSDPRKDAAPQKVDKLPPGKYRIQVRVTCTPPGGPAPRILVTPNWQPPPFVLWTGTITSKAVEIKIEE